MRGVAITGLGLLSALGEGAQVHCHALQTGVCGLSRLTLFDAPGVPDSPVGEAPAAALEPFPRGSRSERLALVAATEAVRQAGTVPSAGGVVAVGTTTGGIAESERHYLCHRGLPGEADRALLRHHAAGAVADRVAHSLSLTGERHTFSTACSSSANAIGYAAQRVAQGAPWALAGGTDSLCRLTFSGFYALKLLSAVPCQPFDAGRVGLSLGEAAAFLFLEPAATARARNARVLGWVEGWGCAADAYHMTAPHPEGQGALAAMRAALEDAGLTPQQVDYVNAHGTATPANDRAEARALGALFGEGQAPWTSSTKGATGHTLGAAGALEAALCVLAMNDGFAPATVGLQKPEAALALRHVPAGGVRSALRVTLSNSFGFGGNNAALVLRRGER